MYHNFINRLNGFLPAQFTDMALLVIAVVFGWWLSGFDSGLAFGGTARNLIRRALRCGASFVVIEMAHAALLRCGQEDTPKQALIWITAALPMAALWYGCISYVVAHGFTSLMDSDDRRAYDPQKSARQMEEISGLVREGKKAAAIKRCKSLKASGDVDAAVVDLMLKQLKESSAAGAPLKFSAPAAPPVGDMGVDAGVDELLAQKYFGSAIELLEAKIKEQPEDFATQLKLAEVYGRHCGNWPRAEKIVHQIATRPGFNPGQVQQAQDRLAEWRQGPAAASEPASEPGPVQG
jgi:hypothetical protein